MADEVKDGAATAPTEGATSGKGQKVTPPKPAESEAPVAKPESVTEEIVYEPPVAKVDQTEAKPTWSRYGNAEAASTGAAIADAEKSRLIQEGLDDPFYTFGGHVDKHNKTEVLATRYGKVSVGGNIKLPDDEVKRLESLGFLFNRA